MSYNEWHHRSKLLFYKSRQASLFRRNADVDVLCSYRNTGPANTDYLNLGGQVISKPHKTNATGVTVPDYKAVDPFMDKLTLEQRRLYAMAVLKFGYYCDKNIESVKVKY